MLEHNLKNGTLTVKLQGEIDHANAPSFRVELDRLIRALKFERFVFDLSEIAFMDSTAVGLILGRYTNLKGLHKHVYFNEPSTVADKVLKVSGLYTIIPKI